MVGVSVCTTHRRPSVTWETCRTTATKADCNHADASNAGRLPSEWVRRIYRRSKWDENGQHEGVALCRLALRQDAGDHWGDRSGIKGSWTTGSVVLCQHTRMGSPTLAPSPSEDSHATFLCTFPMPLRIGDCGGTCIGKLCTVLMV